MQLLRWGVDYDPIWNQHSAYSRGRVEVTIDEQNKSIVFLPQTALDPRFFCTQIEAKKADDERLAGDRPDDQLAELSEAFFDSVKYSEQGMHFDCGTLKSSGAIDVAYGWMKTTCLPELADSINLFQCTVGELRRVLATLYVYSLFVTKLEDVSDDQPRQEHRLKSCVVGRRRVPMIDWLASVSGVPAASVESIVSVLTFDHNHHHVTLAQQPFVESGDGQLLFLPRMLLLLDLPRMYVSAVNKDQKTRKVYANAINVIETAGVKSVKGEICKAIPSTIQVVSGKSFKLPNGGKITPDIVLVSEHDRTVLVIDLKYATPPFGPADVHQDVKEFEKWKTRMAEYLTSFQSHPQVLCQHFSWAIQESVTVFGLILTRWPLPVPINLEEPVGAVDWASLKAHLLKTPISSIREFMLWAENRPDVTVPTALTWTAKELSVGEWQYRYSVLAPLPRDRVFEMTRNLAYKMWEERGRPLWDDQRDWHDAEAKFRTGFMRFEDV